jgi:drug/metabolite transporter (DMT)-like permease
VNIAIAVVAAMLAGAGLVLQQRAAEQAPKSYFLRWRLIAELLRKRLWLAGIAIMAAGQALSVWTIGHLELSLAEPLLATSLIFALILAVPLSGQPLRKTELLGALILGAGVTALSVARSAGGQETRFGSSAYWPAAAVIAAIAFGFAYAGWRRPGQQRGTLTGVASGLVFGISDALTRRVVEIAHAQQFTALLTSWPAFSLVAAGLIGMWLMESSFNAAPLHASLPGITAAEPVAGMILGVLVFGDVIRVSPGMIALQLAGIAALVTGVLMVARAPALSSLRPRHAAHARWAAARRPTVPSVPHGAAADNSPARSQIAAPSRLLTGITAFAAARPPRIRGAPVGFPGPQRLNQPANRVSESAQDLGCRVHRGRGEPGLPR